MGAINSYAETKKATESYLNLSLAHVTDVDRLDSKNH